MTIGAYVDQIICGGAATTMAGMPAGSIDLVITSPPYWQGENGKSYEVTLSTYKPYGRSAPACSGQTATRCTSIYCTHAPIEKIPAPNRIN